VAYNLHSMNRMVALLLLCATGAYSQSAGTIIGTVVDSDGQAVANAQVQATNSKSKTVYKTTASEQGRYTLATLPPGTYDVSITAPGFNAYNRQNVSIGAAKPLRLDVHLLEYQLGTLGDGREFRVQLTSPHPAPNAANPGRQARPLWRLVRAKNAGYRKAGASTLGRDAAEGTSREQFQGRSRSALPAARRHQRGGFVSLQTGANSHPAGDALRG